MAGFAVAGLFYFSTVIVSVNVNGNGNTLFLSDLILGAVFCM
jgi:hypothetical protein